MLKICLLPGPQWLVCLGGDATHLLVVFGHGETVHQEMCKVMHGHTSTSECCAWLCLMAHLEQDLLSLIQYLNWNLKKFRGYNLFFNFEYKFYKQKSTYGNQIWIKIIIQYNHEFLFLLHLIIVFQQTTSICYKNSCWTNQKLLH